MSRGRVLVTGGAGFIGSHLVDALVEAGYPVRILDAFVPQVHPDGAPLYLNPKAEVRRADIRDAAAVSQALGNVESIVHLAAAVGVGQSMYEVQHYCSVNVLGTANLLEVLVKQKLRPRRVVVASSMSIYGEGLYECAECGPQSPPPRTVEQLARREWWLRCPECSRRLKPLPTPESKRIHPTSVYAVNKRDQEDMVLTVCRSLGIPAVGLRFFNVYGERQSLSNPYTGVVAIFSSALINDRRPVVFEDGEQLRDFVHVSDIVQGCLLALDNDQIADEVFNVGTGIATNLLDLFTLLKRDLGVDRDLQPEVLGRFREGDIRACTADISRARLRLGYEPRVRLEDGIESLTGWLRSQSAIDRSTDALQELRQHDLVR